MIQEERLIQVIRAPHVSEKTTGLTERDNVITIEVLRNANKREIKQAVEKMFEVEVEKVTTVNVKGKQKRTGLRTGRQKTWKKAYVTLKEGSSLDLAGTGE